MLPIYVMGQVRVPGSYSGRICLPKNYEEADISAEPEFEKLCARSLPQAGDLGRRGHGELVWHSLSIVALEGPLQG